MFAESGSAKATSFNDLSPQQMLDELRSEMKSIRTEESALKRQILDLNEQFQDVITLAAEIAKKPTRTSVTTEAQRSDKNPPLVNTRTDYQSRLYNKSRAAGKTDNAAPARPGYRASRAKLALRISLGERWKAQENQAREARGKAREQTTPTDFSTDLSPTGINPQKIRSSLPTSPVEGEDDLQGTLAEMGARRKKNLKKRMIDRRKVDVVHLGLF